MAWNASIRSRLLIYFSGLVALLVAISCFAVYKLAVIDKRTEHLEEKWLTATSMLGEITTLLPEIHVEVLHRLSAPRASDRLLADDTLAAAVTNLRDLQSAYQELLESENESALFALFGEKIDRFVAAQVPVIDDFDQGLITIDTAHDRLKALSLEADQAGHRLLDLSLDEAAADAETVDVITDTAIFILCVVTVFGLLLAGWTVIVVRNRISRPLAAITGALSELSQGKDSMNLPYSNRPDEIGEMARAFDVFRQNASALAVAHVAAEAAQKRAQALARHDMLTGLPNRRVFAEELEKAIPHAVAGKAAFGVLLIDLDRFKPANDVYGHSVGDAVLVEIAQRLREVVDKRDTVARLGGDEFAVIARFDAGPESFAESAIKLANRLIAAVSERIVAGDVSLEVGASIGIANCPLDGTQTEDLLRAADIAMYKAKREERGTFRFFEHSMDVELRERAALESDLRRAVVNGEIKPFYQPLISLADRKLLGFEVLARWAHPNQGLLPPAVFISLAEEIGLISDLTFGLLRRACLDAQQWPGDLMFAINISPFQLKDPLLASKLLAILSETGFPPHRLELEITESALVTDMEMAKSVLTSLQKLGVRIALDDFGTGYSSLYHLRELTLDKVKIDRSFVQSMNSDQESEKIVNAILSLTHSLGLPTVAEGIEDADTLQRMIASGCEFGQGFYFGKPMPADEAQLIADKSAGRGRLKIAV